MGPGNEFIVVFKRKKTEKRVNKRSRSSSKKVGEILGTSRIESKGFLNRRTLGRSQVQEEAIHFFCADR